MGEGGDIKSFADDRCELQEARVLPRQARQLCLNGFTHRRGERHIRAGAVEKTPGFEWFELLRPLEGTDQYLVYTRWSSEEEDCSAWSWVSSQPTASSAALV